MMRWLAWAMLWASRLMVVTVLCACWPPLWARLSSWPAVLSPQQFTVVALALLTSIGVAGIPSASLVAILVIMNNVNIQNGEAFIGLLLAVDRLLDMTRTAVNVFSDSCGAVVIAKSRARPKTWKTTSTASVGRGTICLRS